MEVFRSFHSNPVTLFPLLWFFRLSSRSVTCLLSCVCSLLCRCTPVRRCSSGSPIGCGRTGPSPPHHSATTTRRLSIGGIKPLQMSPQGKDYFLVPKNLWIYKVAPPRLLTKQPVLYPCTKRHFPNNIQAKLGRTELKRVRVIYWSSKDFRQLCLGFSFTFVVAHPLACTA